MKIYIKYIAVILITGFWSCEPNLDTEGISRITHYPTILLKGERWNQIPVGGSFVDPGVTALEGDTPLTPTISGSVDTNVPGVYTIQYDAVNRDGYSASEYRYVGVIASAVEGTDISGTYQRNAGARGISSVSRVVGNLYYSNNVGGVAVPDPSLGVYFYHFDTGKIGVPFQRTPGNAFACTNASIMEGVSYSWVVINSTYGTALRTFVKQ